MGAAGLPQLQELVVRLINISTTGTFLIVLIMLITAGIKFMTSGGEAKSISSAGMTITWALLGILFLALAWLALLLIQAFTGVQVTQFCLNFDLSGCK